jgi:putative transposase
VYQRTTKRPQISSGDRVLWSWLAHRWLFNVTEHPTAQWTGQQIIEAFPWDTAPKYLLRDRDAIYGSQFQQRVQNMGIEEVLTAPRSPWQNAFVERVIGSIRRDCLDHVVVLNDRHLKRILTSYFNYYHRWRTQLSLGMDSPESRTVQSPALGKVVHNQKSVAYTIITNGWRHDSV